VAVASAVPYASLHLAPDKQSHQQPTTLFFLQAGRPSCLPTNSIKALKAKHYIVAIIIILKSGLGQLEEENPGETG